MSLRTVTLSLFLGLSLALTACGSSPTPTPAATAAPVATAVVAATVVATNTAAPPTAMPATATTAATARPTTASSPSASAAATVVPAGTSASSPAASAATGTITAAGVGAAGSPRATGATIFTIVSDQSEASYTVNEKVFSLPTPRDAVGKTNAIVGQIVLGADGKPTDASTVTVDLTTLKSDQPNRDNAIKKSGLESTMYPMAVFTITGVDGLNAPLVNGVPTAFKLLGNLTLHGVTKPVAFDTNATMQGDALNGTATITFKMGDFNMTPPVSSVLSVSDVVKLDLKINAKKAG